jgi:glutathione synthase/RimK-type ligase-like ATP-grasp enzyme
VSGARVLLLGPARDPHLAALARALDDEGAQSAVVDSRTRPAGPRVTFAPAGAYGALGDVELDEITAAFVRAVPPRHPRFVDDNEGPLSREQARTAEAEGGALRDAVAAAIERVWANGRPVLNPPVGGVYEQQKPWQLSVARRAGVDVPRTIVTNDPAQARRFLEGLDDGSAQCVAKPVRGPGFADLVDVDDERLERLVRAPVVLQERVIGDAVRVLLLDTRLLCAAHIAGTEALDYRADPAWQAGEASYEPIEIEDDQLRPLVSLAHGLGIPFAGIDLMRRPDGTFVFLEVNAAPAWLEMEERTGAQITAALAARLLRTE